MLAFDDGHVSTVGTGSASAGATKVDVSSWRLSATTADSLRDEIMHHMAAQPPGVTYADLCKLLAANDDDPDHGAISSLTPRGFTRCMHRIGYVGSEDAPLHTVFETLDADQSGHVGVSEVHAWLSGKTARVAAVRSMTLLGGSGRDSLAQVEWTPHALRTEVQWMLVRNGLSPMALLRGWDRSNDGTLSVNEFLYMWKRLVDDLTLWDEHVRDLVLQVT
jgi:Ca2+-binding EF-hand superfamily protein